LAVGKKERKAVGSKEERRKNKKARKKGQLAVGNKQ
jgi:hypothetical protein